MKRLRILLGGVTPLFGDLRKTALDSWGFDIHSVADGKQACSALFAGQSDLCILDWDMPKMSGLQACHWIRSVSLKWQPYVILVTHKDQPEQVRDAYLAGANDFIARPFQVEDLRFVISTFAHRISQTHVLHQEIKSLDPLEQYRRDLAVSAKLQRRI